MSYLPSAPSASLLDIFARYPSLTEPLHAFAQVLMRGPSEIEAGERELIAAYVSALNGCQFCQASHLGAAEHFGFAPDTLAQLLEDSDNAPIRAELKSLLRFVRKLNDSPADISDRDVADLLDAGWHESAVVHAVLVCGFFNLMNRWVDGLGVEADPTIVKAAARQLYASGYEAVAQRAIQPRGAASAGD